MKTRRAFTLVEMSVAILVASIVLVGAYQAIVVMVHSQKSADVKASRSLLEAQLLETLLLDLRSRVVPPDAVATNAAGPPNAAGHPPSGVLTEFDRHVMHQRVLEVRRVKWARDGPERVVREEGGRKQVFDFHGLLDPDVSTVEFRLEACPGEFLSPEPAAAGTK